MVFGEGRKVNGVLLTGVVKGGVVSGYTDRCIPEFA